MIYARAAEKGAQLPTNTQQLGVTFRSGDPDPQTDAHILAVTSWRQTLVHVLWGTTQLEISWFELQSALEKTYS